MDPHDRQGLCTKLRFVTSLLLNSFVRGHLLLTDRSQAGDPTVRLAAGSLHHGRWVKSLYGALLPVSVTVMLGCTAVELPCSRAISLPLRSQIMDWS